MGTLLPRIPAPLRPPRPELGGDSVNAPVLGILGGVGPLATAYFMELVIKQTPATCDQDNIPMIVFNDPQIPDRTSFILDREGNPDPLPEMLRVVHWLEDAGADYIAIPCNTAHYFYDALAREATVPVLNIMRETAAHVAGVTGGSGRVGLLATDGTISSGVFQRYLEERGLTAVTPSTAEQSEVVMPLIYERVKRNLPYDARPFFDVARRLHEEEGCDAVIVGCTELSVVYQDLREPPSYLVDAMDVLARRCVSHYLEQRDDRQRQNAL